MDKKLVTRYYGNGLLKNIKANLPESEGLGRVVTSGYSIQNLTGAEHSGRSYFFK